MTWQGIWIERAARIVSIKERQEQKGGEGMKKRSDK